MLCSDLSCDVRSRGQRAEATFERHHLASVQDIKNLQRKVSSNNMGALMYIIIMKFY